MSTQVDVLAVIDELRSGWYGETSRLRMPPEIRGAWMRLDIARANVAALIAEHGALAQEVERLRRDCAEAYQVVGAGMFGEPCRYTQADVERALDNLSAAANGDPRPHDDLLPWPSAFVIRRPTGESA